ncbi:hypothetical protein CCACVL1_00595 [Corchorus capsularis]|uniref:Stigma-specific protein Stig1 n=1 Tax=Corchorus capsularis TaxID=210143 RepID=A0A1R3KW41_COCAP|nr:hypothetical protein CCACVL1_00595 [Corchorus capsularis]
MESISKKHYAFAVLLAAAMAVALTNIPTAVGVAGPFGNARKLEETCGAGGILGSSCNSDEQCGIGVCRSGSCCHQAGNRCKSATHCCNNGDCQSEKCCIRNGCGCNFDVDCCGGSCNISSNTCCGPLGTSCESDGNCCDGVCTAAPVNVVIQLVLVPPMLVNVALANY